MISSPEKLLPRPDRISAFPAAAVTRFFQNSRLLRWTLFLAGASFFVFLAWRQHRFVDHYAVNMMFWDQWDFYTPFFNDQDSWAIFTRQHGPHRQGAGFLVAHVVAELGRWNSRWDAFTVSFTLMAAALAGLNVAMKCGCPVWLSLPLIGLIFFNLRQYEGFVGASNLSHGAFPLLLFMLYALSWFVRTPALRLALLSILNFLLIFTGFGLFVGLITPVLLLVEMVHVFKAGQILRAWLALGALALSAFSWMLFSRGYVFSPAVDGFHFPHERPWEYFYFMGLMLANFHGIPGHHFPSIVAGLLIVTALVVLCMHHGWRIARKGIDDQRVGVVIFCLAAYALLYCLNTAVGRVSLGLDAAPAASRYVTLLIPAALALCIAVNHAFPRKAVAMGLAYAFLLGVGTLTLRQSDWKSVNWFHDGREAWKAAYLKTHDETLANQLSSFPVYPVPGAITQRLQYLEEHHLNLFSGPPPPPPK